MMIGKQIPCSLLALRRVDVYKRQALDCSVDIITNAKSQRMGKKDIIKIDQEMPLDLDLLGYIDPGISVNIILYGKLVEKKKPEMPARVVNVMECKNCLLYTSRCV